MVRSRPAYLMTSSPRSGRASLTAWSSFQNAKCFHVGDQVRILQGPFAGCLYAGMRAHERVPVLLALLGGQQRVEVPKADVEAVSNTGPGGMTTNGAPRRIQSTASLSLT